MGMGAGASMASDKGDVGSNVKVVGLLAMGVTLILMGLGFLPSPYSKGFVAGTTYWAATPTASVFGGGILVILGLIALYKSHPYWGSAFVAYGAFFLVWTMTVTVPFSVAAYGLAGFTFVFLLLTLTFLVNSMKHGWMSFFLFLFLFISFILWVVWYWMVGAGNTISDGQYWATGGLTIFTGLIAWYMGTAHLTNSTYGRKFLPG